MLNLSATLLLPAAATALFLFFPISLALASILMLVILVLWLFTGRFRARWDAVRGNPVAWGALAIYALVLIGVLYSPADWDEISLHLTKYLKLPFAVVLMTVITSDRLQQRCLDAFIAAMGFVLASTWLNVWWDLPWSKTHNQGWHVTHHVFGDYITQNIMMAFMVLVALVRMVNATTPRRRAAWAAVSVLAIVSITHLSEGRTGYLLLCVVLAVFVFSALRGRNMWFAAILGACLTAGVLASSELVRERVVLAYTEVQRANEDKATSVGNRMYLYRITPLLAAEKPVLGQGTGAYHSEICRFVDIPEGCHGWINWHPHNQFLFFAADHGIPGFVAYVFMLLSMVWLARRAKDPETRVLLIGLAALLAVNSMTNSPLWSARESHFFTYMMALLSCRILARPAALTTSPRPSEAPHA